MLRELRQSFSQTGAVERATCSCATYSCGKGAEALDELGFLFCGELGAEDGFHATGWKCGFDDDLVEVIENPVEGALLAAPPGGDGGEFELFAEKMAGETGKERIDGRETRRDVPNGQRGARGRYPRGLHRVGSQNMRGDEYRCRQGRRAGTGIGVTGRRQIRPRAFHPVERETPQRTLEHLRPLATVEFEEEILEVIGRRGLVAFEPQQALEVFELVVHVGVWDG